MAALENSLVRDNSTRVSLRSSFDLTPPTLCVKGAQLIGAGQLRQHVTLEPECLGRLAYLTFVPVFSVLAAILIIKHLLVCQFILGALVEGLFEALKKRWRDEIYAAADLYTRICTTTNEICTVLPEC